MKKISLSILALLPACISLGQSISWSAPVSVASNSYNNLHPRIGLNASGNPLIIWGDNSGNVKFSRWNGSAFTNPVNINAPGTNVFAQSWAGPDMASKGDSVYVVYKTETEDTGHVYLRYSYNGGINFNGPVLVENLDPAVNKSRFPTVGINGSGNPVVGFMKFDAAFGNAGWVIAKSNDHGQSFQSEVNAGGYSGGEACDCCPGTITNNGNTVAMLYRDNLSNVRNMWTGISTDNGSAFPSGMNIDKNNWMVMACPSSGPDGIIIGDSLFATFMSNTDKVYWSRSSVTTKQASIAFLVPDNSGTASQNYPRIAGNGTAAAIVWKQDVSSGSEVPLLFTSNIHNGFPATYEVAGSDNMNMISNADVSMGNGTIHVVWQDGASGTVKYRRGTFSGTSETTAAEAQMNFNISPNPASNKLLISLPETILKAKIILMNVLGDTVYSVEYDHMNNILLDLSGFTQGIYFLSIENKGYKITKKVLITHNQMK